MQKTVACQCYRLAQRPSILAVRDLPTKMGPTSRCTAAEGLHVDSISRVQSSASPSMNEETTCGSERSFVCVWGAPQAYLDRPWLCCAFALSSRSRRRSQGSAARGATSGPATQATPPHVATALFARKSLRAHTVRDSATCGRAIIQCAKAVTFAPQPPLPVAATLGATVRERGIKPSHSLTLPLKSLFGQRITLKSEVIVSFCLSLHVRLRGPVRSVLHVLGPDELVRGLVQQVDMRYGVLRWLRRREGLLKHGPQTALCYAVQPT